jgi:hypothetical protein
MPLGGSSRRSILLDTFVRADVPPGTIIEALQPNQSDVFNMKAWIPDKCAVAEAAMREVIKELWAGSPDVCAAMLKKQQTNTLATVLVKQEMRRRDGKHPV